MPKKTKSKANKVMMVVNTKSLGGLLGGLLGSLGSQLIPIPGVNGQALGTALGSMTGLKRGGVRMRARGGK